jgi:2-polyprenyl-3-methyl-5-hydroxy-6-metoxy-1,4-benzoquinol methylase
LPRVRRPEALLARLLPRGGTLLDVGAGDGSLGSKLRNEGAEVEITSVDPGGGADHRSIDDAPDGFDACVLLEVVEHLSPDEASDLVRRAHDHVKEGGLVVLSTPNVFKPGQFLRDATHRTPWAWDELGALCLASGMSLVSLHRVYNATALSRLLHLALLWPLHRFLEIDCARSVMAVAKREPPAQR